MTALVVVGGDASATRARVDAWRRLLEGARSLSPRYRQRYAIVLAHLEQQATADAVTAAQATLLADDDAGRAAAILASGTPSADGHLSIPSERGDVLYAA